MKNKDKQSTHYDSRPGGASAIAVIWSIAYSLMLGGLLYHSMQTAVSGSQG